jgi:hypothetical protein
LGVWLAVSVGVVAELVVAVFALLFITFGASTTCGQPATLSNVHAGESALIWAAGFGLLPWALAMLVSRRRLWLAVLGLHSVTRCSTAFPQGLTRSSGWAASASEPGAVQPALLASRSMAAATQPGASNHG